MLMAGVPFETRLLFLLLFCFVLFFFCFFAHWFSVEKYDDLQNITIRRYFFVCLVGWLVVFFVLFFWFFFVLCYLMSAAKNIHRPLFEPKHDFLATIRKIRYSSVFDFQRPKSNNEQRIACSYKEVCIALQKVPFT